GFAGPDKAGSLKKLKAKCCTQFGYFIGSRVSGLTYEGEKCSGTTNSFGRFRYKKNTPVTFSVGDLVLGTTMGKPFVTAPDLVEGAQGPEDARVNNLLVFLQTLDQNGNLNDGIQISTAIAQIVSNYKGLISFDQSTVSFVSDINVAALLADLNAADVFTDKDPRARTLRKSLAALEYFQRATGKRKIINTRKGFVRGYESTDSTWQFLGIPYAQPPLGDLRWRPPQSVKKWHGVRDAIAWSDQAAQNPYLQRFGEGGMSEDCLYLNVTTPKTAKNLPVMVWFHGGGFTSLTSNTKAFNNPDGLTNKGVVLVTVNHRLGPFGYMAHPLLSEESGAGSGNYGQMDLIAALQWVQKNIRRFGGNPGNVTIFGESGGGRKTLSLMASPMAKGLFHKAISQSGTLYPDTRSLASAEAYGSALSAAMGAETLEDLRAKSWTQIVAAASATVVPYTNVDGIYLPFSERQSYETGQNNDVPFMISINTNDTPDPIGTIKNVLPWMSDYKSASVYACLFDHAPSGWQNQGVLAYHACELTYVFNFPESAVVHHQLGLVLDPATGASLIVGDLDGDGISGSYGDTDDIFISMGFNEIDQQVAETTMTMWTNFAKYGNPSTEDLIWPSYMSENDTYVKLGEFPTVETGLSEISFIRE
ncbi:MAG: carboxylesterase family protein, partial [Proteobacteria bacterium]|nr:carboxylesterase family protein [Pseudomonadota bacterium]